MNKGDLSIKNERDKIFHQIVNNENLCIKNEEILEAANRELQEEIGHKANKLSNIFTLDLAPGYIDHKTYIVLAEELNPSKLEGDEPEALEVVECKFSNLNNLICNPKNNIEARAIACVYLLQNHLNLKI